MPRLNLSRSCSLSAICGARSAYLIIGPWVNWQSSDINSENVNISRDAFVFSVYTSARYAIDWNVMNDIASGISSLYTPSGTDPPRVKRTRKKLPSAAVLLMTVLISV